MLKKIVSVAEHADRIQDPTEIFPTWLRAKGNAFGVAGWAIGYGGGSLLVPVMFAGINEKTYYVFGAAMLAYIPLVYCFLPETAGRTLESIDMLFCSKSAFVWEEEREFQKRMEVLETTDNLWSSEKPTIVAAEKVARSHIEDTSSSSD